MTHKLLFFILFLNASLFAVTQEGDNVVCPQPKWLDKTHIFLKLESPLEARRFYSEQLKGLRAFAWFDQELKPSKLYEELMAQINDAYDHGLYPDKYHKKKIPEYMDKIEAGGENRCDAYANLDALLTDAYMTLAKDLYYGFTDWRRFQAYKISKDAKDDKFEWDRPKKAALDIPKYLQESLEKKEVGKSLQSLSPDFEEYRKLIDSLKKYRTLHANGGWDTIPTGTKIKINQTDGRIGLIKKRLVAEGDLDEVVNEKNNIYNEESLINAVKAFQIRHNLTNDGVIGNKTIAAMNLSSSDKVNKIILNLERFRWIDTGIVKTGAYISVNIPSFQMRVFENGDEMMNIRVIVGKKDRPTPILTSKLSYATLNPSWTAPSTIVKEDILGKKNVLEYLQSHNMKVYANADGAEINATTIDWKSYVGKENTPFRFKAEAGKKNPLGEIKFNFDNKYSVYMHDTNERGLFQNQYRALSSGCIRVGEPKKLLDYLSEKNDTIEKKITDQTLELKKKLPIIIQYMTVEAGKDGSVYFYEDIYRHDERHTNATR
ncbi:MAG TPA: L,D-transpeptidase family protein [Campylobacterales bacterium]|nr:L,D-transpeptidase family protein [Campylobacterales bacterium]